MARIQQIEKIVKQIRKDKDFGSRKENMSIMAEMARFSNAQKGTSRRERRRRSKNFV